MDKNPTYAFFQTIWVNFIDGRRTGTVSRKYPLYATPSSDTFSIWSIIYMELFIYSFLLSNNEKKDFLRSMELNQKWIRAFKVEKLKKSFDIIKEMRDVNNRLQKKTKYKRLMDTYATWVQCATVLNESIYNKHVLKMVDNSFDSIVTFMKGKLKQKLRDREKYVLRWALKGVRKSLLSKNTEKSKKDAKTISELLKTF